MSSCVRLLWGDLRLLPCRPEQWAMAARHRFWVSNCSSLSLDRRCPEPIKISTYLTHNDMTSQSLNVSRGRVAFVSHCLCTCWYWYNFLAKPRDVSVRIPWLETDLKFLLLCVRVGGGGAYTSRRRNVCWWYFVILVPLNIFKNKINFITLYWTSK